jgi:hypothetical protein
MTEKKIDSGSWKVRMVQPIKRFVKHPLTKLSVGLILVVTSGLEIAEDLLDEIPGIQLGGHHGLMLFGIVNAISSIPELVEGLEHAMESTEAEIENRFDTEAPDE